MLFICKIPVFRIVSLVFNSYGFGIIFLFCLASAFVCYLHDGFINSFGIAAAIINLISFCFIYIGYCKDYLKLLRKIDNDIVNLLNTPYNSLSAEDKAVYNAARTAVINNDITRIILLNAAEGFSVFTKMRNEDFQKRHPIISAMENIIYAVIVLLTIIFIGAELYRLEVFF